MSEHELEKLLGGFAADTLTPDERRVLYRAALDDQQLFDALADEQALKELLADPAVRRRLLQSLTEAHKPQTIRSMFRLDRLRRPAGLALAGGLAAAALAVVLGTKIYQESLRHSASVATDEPSPATPSPVSEPAEPRREADSPDIERAPSAQRNAPGGPPGKREHPAVTTPQEPPRPAAAQDRRQRDALPPASSKTADEGSSPADRRPSSQEQPARRAPPSPAPPQPGSPPAASAATSQSARALYYAGLPPFHEERPEALRETARDETGDRRSADAPAKEMKRPESPVGLLGKLSAAPQRPQTPLGIRYSLLMAGPGGIDMEVDPSTPVGKDDAPRLTVQTNQDGYLSLYAVETMAGTPTLLFPSEGDGRMSAGKTVIVPLTPLFERRAGVEPTGLLVVFSRGPRHRQAAPLNPPPAMLLMEQVAPGQPDTPAEHALYVVATAPGPALSFNVPLSLRP
jgi:hypothetical protein